MRKVFISHAYKDKELLQEFIKSIKVLGRQIFFSSNSHSNSISLGENMFEKIKHEIRNSDVIIAMVSYEFYESIPCQIEMGMAYAFEKKIIPLIITKEPDYNNMLKGIFSTHNRASCIYNKKDVATIFSKLSSEVLLINECTDNVMKNLPDSYRTKPIKIIDNSNNLIKDMIMNKEFNTNETIFIKYMVENRKFELETGWQTEDGVIKFKDWLENSKYYINGDLTEVYNNTIKYFDIKEIIEEAEYTCHGNIKLYKIKQKYLSYMMEFYQDYGDQLDQICNAQYIPF